ncbi:YkgJ family cysteine cluster protein [Gemmata sp. JC673]|uniref:YkgJ family cysteine cluster protein n=1 Tax=Gemmata algarum TaxID=2975278 RepID=A0ABU5F4J5_9BACT|nr:YkgJ family cysteine cluster protein [Gemmata algarum]MDY3560816.1 YkgJ family cysteine cluster protein [Gemmata algarum]
MADSQTGAAEPEPWYKDGLAFECTQCGDCCTGAPGFVWVTDEELAAIAAELGEPVGEVRDRLTRRARGRRTLRERSNGDCVLLDAKRGCSVYRVRPAQCRTWPFWESNIETPEDWKRTCDICPGSGRGEVIPVEEISRRLKVIKM